MPHDPGFDDAKRKWGELDEFFTTVYQAYLQATTGIIGTIVASCPAFLSEKNEKNEALFLFLFLFRLLIHHQPSIICGTSLE